MKHKASDAAAKAMVKYGLKMDVKSAKKELFADYIKDIEGATTFEKFLEKKKCYSDKCLAVAINAYIKAKEKYLKPYPAVKSTLKKLKGKGIKLAIVTDAPKIKALQRLDSLGIMDYFDVVVGHEDTGRNKPSKLPFKKALKDVLADVCDKVTV